MQVQERPKQTLLGIPDGGRGTRATLQIMARLVRESRANGEIRGQAREIVDLLPQKAWRAQVRAIFYFVRDQVRYLSDPVDLERVAAPEVTLNERAGDCDDKSVLLAALLASIGHPSRFVAVGFDAPGVFDHVYVETLAGDNEWIPLDATENVEPGWAPPNPVARMVEKI